MGARAKLSCTTILIQQAPGLVESLTQGIHSAQSCSQLVRNIHGSVLNKLSPRANVAVPCNQELRQAALRVELNSTHKQLG